jgi:hypothetical protein
LNEFERGIREIPGKATKAPHRLVSNRATLLYFRSACCTTPLGSSAFFAVTVGFTHSYPCYIPSGWGTEMQISRCTGNIRQGEETNSGQAPMGGAVEEVLAEAGGDGEFLVQGERAGFQEVGDVLKVLLQAGRAEDEGATALGSDGVAVRDAGRNGDGLARAEGDGLGTPDEIVSAFDDNERFGAARMDVERRADVGWVAHLDDGV